MCSTRNAKPARRSRFFRTLAAAALVGVLAPALTGCRTYKALSYQRPVEPAMDPAAQEDEAMARRQWREQQALYANSGVTTYANRFRYNYETTQHLRPVTGILVGPLAFVGQTLAFPLSFFRAPVGETQVNRPLAVEPS